MNNRRYSPIKPFPPHLPKRTEFRLSFSNGKEVIYRDVSVLGDSEINLEEYFRDQDEELPKDPDIRRWQNLSLQDIVDLAPPNTRLCDIILNIDMPRYMEYLDLSFIKHNRDLDREEEAYQKALQKYNKDVVKYKKDLAKYEEELEDYENWVKDQELAELEAKIKKLKKSK
jgi:hypothetical protein